MSRLRWSDVEVLDGDRLRLRTDGELRSGAWLAVLGPNGAGKSTFLRCLAGMEDHGGHVMVGDQRQASASRAEWARRVALVPQNPVVPEGMSVAEYVLLGRTAHLSWFGAEGADDRSRVAEVIDQLDLAELADRPLDRISGGELQRATLARALVTEAEVLLLDEPTSALDLAHQLHVLELVDEVRRARGLTVVAAMHDLTLAGRFADRLTLLADGETVAAGGVDDVLTSAVLSRTYGVDIRILDDPDLGRIITPVPRPPAT